jgi:hypothetical protein
MVILALLILGLALLFVALPAGRQAKSNPACRQAGKKLRGAKLVPCFQLV